MVNLMDDDDLKKSVIDQMMGELDDVTADSLRKPKGPVGGVEIAITVSPKSGEAADEEMDDCTDEDCEIPEHGHGEKAEESEGSDYINQLIKKLD